LISLFEERYIEPQNAVGAQILGTFRDLDDSTDPEQFAAFFDRVYVWFARWSSAEDEEHFCARWAALSGWRDGAPDSVLPGLMRKPERLRLSPTPRSALQ
jgi:hypothetical protein